MPTINPTRVWRAFLTALQELREDGTKRDDPKQIVVRNRREQERAKANLGTRPLDGAGNGRALTKWKRNGAHAQTYELIFYRRPEDRKRVTGSAKGIACRRKIQRATANPIAA
jgi:hypothetical protein